MAIDDEQVKRAAERRRQALSRVMGEVLPLSHPDAEPARAYLRNRGIAQPLGDLHYHPALEYWHDGAKSGTFPALVAVVSDKNGRPVTAHRTYLTTDGQKAHVPEPRKLMPPPTPGETRGCAVRLGEPGHRLAIAEGIETALAYAQLTNWTTWAAISAGGMATVEIPDWVDELIIAADNDASGTGRRAAEALARRLLLERPLIKILIKTPPNVGEDWNDVLRRQGEAND